MRHKLVVTHPNANEYDGDMYAVWRSLSVRSQIEGYAAAIVLPVGITYAVAWLGWPAFVFEHLVVLVVVLIAIPWGLGPAIAAAAVSVIADNVLQEPIGRPTITGYRDLLDLALFAAGAVVVSELVRRAHAARLLAENLSDARGKTVTG